MDTTEDSYELLALSFDGTTPKFASNAKKNVIDRRDLTVYYDLQCPYAYHSIELVKRHREENRIPVSFVLVDTLQKAKELSCVFNNWAVFYKGKLETVNLIDTASLKRILRK